MDKHWLLLVAALAVAACGDSSPNPVNGQLPPDDGTGETPGEGGDEDVDGLNGVIIPEGNAENVRSVQWIRNGEGDADDQLIVEGVPLDDSPVQGVYTRAASEDLDGYIAFTKQDDRLDRIFLAMAGETPDGAVRGFVVGEGGQFDIEFGGANYQRDAAFTPPDVETGNGLVSYAGRYVGITDLRDPDQAPRLNPFGENGDQTVPRNLDGTVLSQAIPQKSRVIRGKVFMNVDFADNQVNGVISERTFEDGGRIGDEEYLILKPGDIDEQGNFAGEAEQKVEAEEDLRAFGGYAGAFGGENASGMVGVVTSQESVLRRTVEGGAEDIEESSENGLFVIPRCSSANADPICGELQDVDGLIDPR